MNGTTQAPSPADGGGDLAVTYVLVPFFLVTVAGIIAAVVMYVRKRRRVDRLRHQLLPVYAYDPSEELNEAEQELLWKEEDTKICSIKHASDVNFKDSNMMSVAMVLL